MASTSSPSSVNEFCPDIKDTSTNHLRRHLRSFRAPLKAIHTQEECSFGRTSQMHPTRESTKTRALRDVASEHGAFIDSSASSVKRPRVALGTQALVATHQHCTPQNLRQTPQYLSAVCSVPLPPLYGCCDDLPVGHEGVRTRSMETQTSGVPNDFYSKYILSQVLVICSNKFLNKFVSCFSTC